MLLVSFIRFLLRPLIGLETLMAAISAQEFDEVTVNGEACFERADRGGAGRQWTVPARKNLVASGPPSKVYYGRFL